MSNPGFVKKLSHLIIAIKAEGTKLYNYLLSVLFPVSSVISTSDRYLDDTIIFPAKLSLKKHSYSSIRNIWYVCDYNDKNIKETFEKIKRGLYFDRLTDLSDSMGCALQLLVNKGYTYDVISPVTSDPTRTSIRGFTVVQELCNNLPKHQFYPLFIDQKNTELANTTQKRAAIKLIIKYNVSYTKHMGEILLIDDICSSGTTLNQHAKLLKRHGAKVIDALVFCSPQK